MATRNPQSFFDCIESIPRLLVAPMWSMCSRTWEELNVKLKFDLSMICPKLQFTHFAARIISYLKTHVISNWHLLSGHCPSSIPKSSILDVTIWLGNQIVVPLTLRVKCLEYLFRRSIPSFAISPVGASKKIRLQVGWLEVTRSVLVGWWWGQQCLGERLIEVAPECRLV